MCLLAIAWQAHDEFPLVVCANRDEFYARPSEPAHFWPDHPNVFAGRDLRSGGSWMGISQTGRFCAVTNVREPGRFSQQARSRGELVSRFLGGNQSATGFCQRLQSDGDAYNGYNLVAFDGRQLVYQSNRVAEPGIVTPGIHALSNATLGHPWPKTRSARNKLQDWLHAPTTVNELALLLNDNRPADDNALPETGVPLAWERLLSAEFISSDEYGTRCSTGLMVHRSGRAELYEVSHDKGGVVIEQALDGFIA